MRSKNRIEFVNVQPEVKKAIGLYCTSKGITRANYLENDKRLKTFMSQG